MLFKTRAWALLAVAALLLVGFGCASTPEAPAEDTSWKFHTIVDTAFVQQYAKVPVPADTMMIDSRPKKPKFDQGYIPSAVSIPDKKLAEMNGSLPENTEALLIFYCQGPT